jgi:hypothetical protein
MICGAASREAHDLLAYMHGARSSWIAVSNVYDLGVEVKTQERD